MANPAFMEGVHAFKKGKALSDNPYKQGLDLDSPDYSADLWAAGFVFEQEMQCEP